MSILIMNRNQAKEILPIIQALADGRTIQFAATDKEWVDLDSNDGGVFLETLINSPQSYRIKPEPKFRPFKNAEECWNEMQKHQPFGWIKPKDDDVVTKFMLIDALRNEGVSVRTNIRFTYHELLEHYTFADRTPLGIIEEE